MIQTCLQQFKGPKKGKVFQLCGRIGFPYVDCFMLTMPINGM
jgi:hypothetical protein